LFPNPGLASKGGLAIYDLQAKTIEAMGYNSAIFYHLFSTLNQKSDIDVMPRREMQETLSRQGFTVSDNEAQVLKTGKTLGVRYIFFGSVDKRPSDPSATAALNLMDLHQEKVIYRTSLSLVGRDTIKDNVNTLVDELEKAIKSQSLDNSGTDALAGTIPEPSGISLTAVNTRSGDDAIRVEWDIDGPDTSISGFRIYRSEDHDGPFSFIGQTPGMQPQIRQYTDKKIEKEKDYLYRIGILLTSGKEIDTGELAQGRCTSKPLPFAPLVMTQKGYAQRAVIEFIPSILNSKKNFDIQSYKVYRRSEGNLWKLIESKQKKSQNTGFNAELKYTVEDTGPLMDNTRYFYAVTSVTHSGIESEKSDAVSITTFDAPKLVLEKDNMLRKIDMSWNCIPGALEYYLYRKSRNGDLERVDKIPAKGPCRYSDTKNNVDGMEYTYRLTAFDGVKQTGVKNEIHAKTRDLIRYPDGFQAKGGLLKQVELNWIPLSDPDVGGYTLYRKTNQGTFKKITDIRDRHTGQYTDKISSFFLDGEIIDGKTYTYYIKAVNRFGVEGPASEKITARTKPAPGQIARLTVTPKENLILLAWEKSQEADVVKYTVSRKAGSGLWQIITECPATLFEYRDRDLKPGIQYLYSVFATDRDNLKSNPKESGYILSPVPIIQ